MVKAKLVRVKLLSKNACYKSFYSCMPDAMDSPDDVLMGEGSRAAATRVLGG